MKQGSEFDELFRSDKSIWLKAIGAAAAGGIAAFAAVKKNRDLGIGLASTIVIGGAVIGCIMGVMLSLKDIVRRRIESGETVHPLLKLYLGMRFVSVIVWFVTIIVLVFVFIALAF